MTTTLPNLLMFLSTILSVIVLYVAWQTMRTVQHQSQPQACNSPRLCAEPVHWVPTKYAGALTRKLQSRGFLVLNAGSTNGATVLVIREA